MINLPSPATPAQLWAHLRCANDEKDEGDPKEQFARLLEQLPDDDTLARMDSSPLNLFTVYERPADYPGGFVVRRWESDSGNVEPREVVGTASTLNEARKLIPLGLFNLGRKESDDRCIIETWI